MILTGVVAGSIATAVAPSAPQSFTATAASSTQINLSWAAPATNGGAAITSYTLKRGATTIYTGAGTSFSDTGLTAATAYSYTVLATNSAGNGPTASASTTTLATVPTAPQSFSASAASSSSINLSWAAPASNGGAAISSYTLKRGATTIYTGAGTSFTDTGLARVTNYSYTVLANNSAGAGPTASANATTQGTVPGTPTITGVSNGGHYGSVYIDVNYSWSVDNGGLSITNTQILVYANNGAFILHEYNTNNSASSLAFTIYAGWNETYPVAIRCANALGYGGFVSDYATDWAYYAPPEPPDNPFPPSPYD